MVTVFYNSRNEIILRTESKAEVGKFLAENRNKKIKNQMYYFKDSAKINDVFNVNSPHSQNQIEMIHNYLGE